VTKKPAINGHKPRGAQPGNNNALKHGFYARKFSKLELTDLDTITAALTDEIAMLRVAARRLFDFIHGIDQTAQTLDGFISATNALANIATRIAHITRVQTLLTGDDNGNAAVLAQAIAEIAEELDL